jgi:toxin FitB
MNAAHAMFEEDMAGRVLPFDADAAGHFAEISASRRHAGRPISQIDAQIAAITRSRNASWRRGTVMISPIAAPF